MCQLFETIKIIDSKPQNLDLHDKRMNLSRQKLFGIDEKLWLSDVIHVPDECRTGIFRCRVIYGASVESTEYTPYHPAAIKTLKLVHADTLQYDFKYLDRSSLASLINKDLADDILIVKEGRITDSSFANIVFTDGRYWATPDTPLLRGTMREKLMADGLIRAERITPENFDRFTHFRLINAMLGFDSEILPVSNIIRA